jgi:hypothetical protein
LFALGRADEGDVVPTFLSLDASFSYLRHFEILTSRRTTKRYGISPKTLLCKRGVTVIIYASSYLPTYVSVARLEIAKPDTVTLNETILLILDFDENMYISM